MTTPNLDMIPFLRAGFGVRGLKTSPGRDFSAFEFKITHRGAVVGYASDAGRGGEPILTWESTTPQVVIDAFFTCAGEEGMCALFEFSELPALVRQCKKNIMFWHPGIPTGDLVGFKGIFNADAKTKISTRFPGAIFINELLAL